MRFPRADLWESIQSAAHGWRLCPEDLPAEALKRRWLGALNADERAHYDQLKMDRLRHAYVAGRALIRATLSRYTGVEPGEWKFAQNTTGKPAVGGPAEFASIQFNLTHTDGLVACLVTRAGEVGLDAEKVTRPVDVDAVARHFFSAAEIAGLEAIPPGRRTRRFFEYWVVKEAWLKGRGIGLTGLSEQVSIEWDANGQPRPHGDWHLALHDLGPQYAVATAIRTRRDEGAVPITWEQAEDIL